MKKTGHVRRTNTRVRRLSKGEKTVGTCTNGKKNTCVRRKSTGKKKKKKLGGMYIALATNTIARTNPTIARTNPTVKKEAYRTKIVVDGLVLARQGLFINLIILLRITQGSPPGCG